MACQYDFEFILTGTDWCLSVILLKIKNKSSTVLAGSQFELSAWEKMPQDVATLTQNLKPYIEHPRTVSS